MAKEILEGTVGVEELFGFDAESVDNDVADDNQEDILEQLSKPKEEEEVEKTIEEETPKPKEKEEPAAEEDDEEEEEIVKDKKPSTFLSVAKLYLDKGKWQDVLIEENGKEVKLSEMENLDEETFLLIQEDQEKASKEDIEKNYLSIKDVDDRKKTLTEIILKGGDLKTIFKSEENLNQYLNPFDGQDLNDERVQETVYRNYLKKKNIDPEVIEMTLEKIKKDLTLDSKVNDIVTNYNKAFDEYVKKQKSVLEESEKEEKQKETEYRKNLQKVLKERELKDNDIKKYVDLATKRTSEGDFVVDTLYDKAMQDPNEAVDLIAFLENKEKFLEQYTAKAKTQVNKDIRKIIKQIPDKAQRKSTTIEKEEENILDIFK